MSFKFTLITVALTCCGTLTGCKSQTNIEAGIAVGEAGGYIAANLAARSLISNTNLAKFLTFPLDILSRELSSAQDLAYATEAFRRKKDRWPKDYNELSTFVQQSDGYLYLGQYSQVVLTNLSEDKLQIIFVPQGQTNRGTLMFDAPALH